MPRYEYECEQCSHKRDIFFRVEELDKSKVICFCGSFMKRLISRSNIQCDLEPYFDENINRKGGEWVTSRQHRKRLMKENNLYERG